MKTRQWLKRMRKMRMKKMRMKNMGLLHVVVRVGDLDPHGGNNTSPHGDNHSVRRISDSDHCAGFDIRGQICNGLYSNIDKPGQDGSLRLVGDVPNGDPFLLSGGVDPFPAFAFDYGGD